MSGRVRSHTHSHGSHDSAREKRGDKLATNVWSDAEPTRFAWSGILFQDVDASQHFVLAKNKFEVTRPVAFFECGCQPALLFGQDIFRANEAIQLRHPPISSASQLRFATVFVLHPDHGNRPSSKSKKIDRNPVFQVRFGERALQMREPKDNSCITHHRGNHPPPAS